MTGLTHDAHTPPCHQGRKRCNHGQAVRQMLYCMLTLWRGDCIWIMIRTPTLWMWSRGTDLHDQIRQSTTRARQDQIAFDRRYMANRPVSTVTARGYPEWQRDHQHKLSAKRTLRRVCMQPLNSQKTSTRVDQSINCFHSNLSRLHLSNHMDEEVCAPAKNHSLELVP